MFWPHACDAAGTSHPFENGVCGLHADKGSFVEFSHFKRRATDVGTCDERREQGEKRESGRERVVENMRREIKGERE
eukprot:528710-Pleurochrysis_carterae.AAC.1